jgi:hypothetical protein
MSQTQSVTSGVAAPRRDITGGGQLAAAATIRSRRAGLAGTQPQAAHRARRDSRGLGRQPGRRELAQPARAAARWRAHPQERQ